jgi:Arc/MetJ-type ribon-helix-helix transcriptional regulator
MYYMDRMKMLTIRLPEPLAREIEVESRKRRISKSDVVRERLQNGRAARAKASTLEEIADLIGSVVDDLPADLSARKKHYLRATGYGRNRSR